MVLIEFVTAHRMIVVSLTKCSLQCEPIMCDLPYFMDECAKVRTVLCLGRIALGNYHLIRDSCSTKNGI